VREEKISTKGQVVIPKYIRDAIGLKPGSVVIITKMDDKVLIMKKPENPADALAKTGQDMAMKNIRRQIKGE
jgi:AbrB family looped-hinge helix DNA binding protein